MLTPLVIACTNSNGQNNNTQIQKPDSSLNALSLQTGIEAFAIRLLEAETKAKPRHLKTDFAISSFPNDPYNNVQDIPGGKIVLVPGICFSIESKKAGLDIMNRLRPKVEYKGYRLFLCEDEAHTKKDIAIVRCDDEFTPLVYMQTNGINYKLNTHKLISQLDNLSQTLDLKLIGADFEWCEFEIRKEPKDWNEIVERIAKFYPNILEDANGDIKATVAELKKSRRLYFWFD